MAEPSPDGGALELVSGFADLWRGGLGEAGALRLLDLDSDRVHLVAADADGPWRDRADAPVQGPGQVVFAAAEGLRAREPGPVQVVGHTDDQGTAAW